MGRRFRFKTIRGQLLTLVALPLLLLLGALVLLERVLEGQLLGEAERRVESARKAVQAELNDDLSEVKLALTQVTRSGWVQKALANDDVAVATRVADRFVQDYPGTAIALADGGGRIVAQGGVSGLARLDDIAGLVLPEGAAGIGKVLRLDGCAGAGQGEVPARILAMRAGEGGTVVVCQRLDGAFLERARVKLGLALALADPAAPGQLLVHTDDFPLGAPEAVAGGARLHEVNGAVFAVARFSVALLTDEIAGPRRLEALSALEVTQTRSLVRQDFVIIIFGVIAIGLLALLFGGGLALRMTRALEQVLLAFRRLETQEYAPMDPLDTGDELEELAAGYNQMVEGLCERDRLRETFGKYMTESLVSHVLNNQVRLGGDTLPVTILFSDIRGFTATSEKLDAQSLVALLNEYFTEMVDTVMAYGGVVDKYIGDAMMVVFGAPVPSDDDAFRAVKAAVRMREALVRLNERIVARGAVPLQTGIGIHSGEVVAGNIGSERRMEYTVIGDAVNLASRLESSTKELGVDIVISGATYALVRDQVRARFLSSLTVKGREQPVQAYAVEGLVPGPNVTAEVAMPDLREPS